MTSYYNASGMKPKLFLIGIVHRDPDGQNRLAEFLERLQPRAITVEISPYGLAFRKKNLSVLGKTFFENLSLIAREKGSTIDRLLKNGHIAEIREHFEFPFEYRAAREYAKVNEILLIPADVSRYARRKTQFFHELVSYDNLKTLLDFTSYPLDKKIASEYARAGDYLDGKIDPDRLFMGWNNKMREEWRKREKHIVHTIHRILRCLENHGGGTLVHLGGWVHVVNHDFMGRFGSYNVSRDLLK